ncbi:response regulator [Oleidesulfovibrio alaskensis]|jgi:DNA-binding NarL/FixJ family response regulator|uniref:response regulator n=1 Tax=Oleidesulfovibrio alaskensis TaxID=58180 RepID=UPI00040C565B|nr:response regulator transcription factor [Oleidesulfovibrio alaskensis]MBG0773753.1 response regulator transcription factor [Oleidesulfovibrio alaskensis]MBL3582395.1 response regulator transcription factor [Oleidesulfovibrio alaskensis]
MGEGYSLIIAEDHTLLREGLKSLLQSVPHLIVTGEASDGQMAVDLCDRNQPDLVLMDISMPRMDGVQATRLIKKRHPEVRVLVLTVHGAGEYVYAALAAGADGYVLKDASNDEFILAVESVLGGKIYLSPGVSDAVVKGYLNDARGQSVSSSWETLTPREQEIFQLVAEGYKNREIAEMLVVSVKTVEKHRSNLMQKLGVHSAAELRALALERGIILRMRSDG